MIDQETLEWLDYLLRFDPQASLLLVGTVRIEEISKDHPLTPFWRDVRRTGALTDIELGPLDATGTTALAEQITGHPLENNVAEQLYQETEGNPLFVVETVRAGRLTVIDSEAAPPETVLLALELCSYLCLSVLAPMLCVGANQDAPAFPPCGRRASGLDHDAGAT